jgi:hypothetical protein
VCLKFAIIFVVVDRAFDEEEKDDEDDESETLILVLFVSRSASRIIFGRPSPFPSGRLFCVHNIYLLIGMGAQNVLWNIPQKLLWIETLTSNQNCFLKIRCSRRLSYLNTPQQSKETKG